MKKTDYCSTPNTAASSPGRRLWWLVALLLLPLRNLSAQCSPDTEAPDAGCAGFLSVQTNTQGPNLARITNTQINLNSQDNCTPQASLQLRLTLDGNASTPPTATYLDLNGTGVFEVFLWVGDGAGNWSTCSTPVFTTPPSCAPDNKAPLAVAPPDVQFTEQEFADLDIDFFNMPDDLPKVRAACGVVYHWDNCSNGNSQVQESFYILEGTAAAPKKVQRRFFVTDAAGNLAEAVHIILINTPAGPCNPDIEAPTCVAPPNAHFTEQEFEALDIDFFNMPDDLPKVRAACGSVYHWDNCSNGDSEVQESFYILEGPAAAPQKVQRRFFVTDAAGNLSEAVQYILINSPFSLHVPAYRYPNDTATDSMSLAGGFGHELYPPEDSVFQAPCPGGYSKIERTWAMIDWIYLTSTGNDAEVVLPALDLNNDGITGDPYDIIAIDDSIWLNINNLPVQKLSRRGAVYTFNQLLYNSYILRGTVFLDTLPNCAPDSGEMPLAGMQVKAISQISSNVYTAVTDANGQYEILICTTDTLVEVGLDVPYNYGGSCGSTYIMPLSDGPPAVRNIPVPLTDNCNLLTVDIATWRLRPCFNSTYTVNYCNFSSQTIADTYVEVALDSLLAYTASSIPGTLLSGNTYRFETGDLAPGICDQFTIQVLVHCDAPIGLTHCTEAHIFPADDCPTASPWSGANLRVTGECDGDSVRLQIRNTGMSGMAQSLDFVVTEDLIMAKTAPYQLGPGGTLTVSKPANGATWRLETPQEPGHPWGGVVAAAVEGCGGLNTTGLVNIFPLNDNDPFSSSDCTQNTASYDPNDKQAFPEGYGSEHFIRPNTDIEYLIRFQNTGTDTAFTVVLLDTMSSFLNAAAVRPGAASHPYDFDVLAGNVLRFRFDHILLPDSNVNEAASHGFVKFRVPQQADNPVGTRIENRAGIYFDFNDPVMTNTTWHTISNEFILVHTNEAGEQARPLRVYPNPGAEAVFFELPEPDANRQFWLTDGLGARVAQRAFPEQVFRFERGQLPPGIYFYSITTDNGLIASGRIMLK